MKYYMKIGREFYTESQHCFLRFIGMVLIFSLSEIVDVFAQCNVPPGVEAIKNGDFEQGNTGFTLDIKYVNSATLQTWKDDYNNPNMQLYNSSPGHYLVMNQDGNPGANNAINYFLANVLTESKNGLFDHTYGDKRGKYLHVDGLPSAPNTMWQQTVTITENQTYYFSAWFANLINDNPPVIWFEISTNNGATWTRLNANELRPQNARAWQQFYTTWNSGANTSAILRLINTESATSGNDFALDDVSFINSCAKIGANPIKLPATLLACSFPITLDPGLGAANGRSFTWTDNGGTVLATTPTYSAEETGTYNLCVVETGQCPKTASVVVTTQIPAVSVPPAYCTGTTQTYSDLGTGSNKANYKWYDALSGGNLLSSGQSPSFSLPATGTSYTVYLEDIVVKPLNGSPLFNGTMSAAGDGNNVKIALSVVDKLTLKSVNVHPDPNADACGASGTTKNAKVDLLQNGTVVDTRTVEVTCGQEKTIDLNFNIQPGAYELRIKEAAGGNFKFRSTAFSLTYPGPSIQNYVTITAADKNAGPFSKMVFTEPVTGCGRVPVTIPLKDCNPTITVPPVAICNGATATLTATVGGTGTAPYSYDWGNGFVTSSIMSMSPAVTTIYTVKVKDNAGKIGTTTVTVTVNPLPVIIATGGTICSGNSIDISAAGAGTGGSYTWDSGLGSGTPVSVHPTSNTTYTVTGKDANGCIGTATAMVTVKSCGPVVSVLPDTICFGESTMLTAIASGGAPGYTYDWGNGFGTASTKTVSPGITTTYTVTVKDGAGVTASTTVTVKVNPKPVLTTTNGTVCSGKSADISASGVGAGGTYAWDNGLGDGALKSVTPAVTTTYTVVGTDVNGCKDTASAVVTVNPIPVISPNNPSICSGGSVVLTATGADTYSWAPSTGLASASGPSVTASPSSTITYTVLGKTLAGCSNTATATVTVNPLPLVGVSPNVILCVGDSATLTGSLASTYTWSPATGLSATTGEVVKASPLTTTTYTVTGETSGCPGSPTKQVTVTVNDIPVVVVTKDTVLCNGQSTELFTGNSFATYIWSPSTGITSGAGTAKVTVAPLVTTTYKVVVTDNNGCKNKDSALVTINPVPVVTAAGPDICSGSKTGITLSADIAGPVIYNWTGSGNGAGSGTSNPVEETLFNNTPAAATTTYTITATLNNCTSTPLPYPIKVKPIPLASGLHVPVCSGKAITLSLSHQVKTPGATTVYAWTASGSGPEITGFSTGGSSNPIDETPTNTGNTDETITYSVTPTVDACSGQATVIPVVVKPIPKASASAQAPICGGNPINIDLTATVAGATFAWKVVTAGSVQAPALTGNGTPIAQVLLNEGSAYNTATYTITPTAGGCTGPDIISVVRVNPAPNALAMGYAICSNQSTAIDITSTTAGGATFAWKAVASSASVTGFADGDGPLIAQTLINSGTVNETVIYTITPFANDCYGGADTAVVTIKPIPVVTVVNTDSVFCSGNATNITLSSVTPGTTFSWTAAPGGSVSGASPGTGASIKQTLSATGAQGTVIYTITPAAGGCTGNSKEAGILVNPIPVSNAGPDAGFCIGDSVKIGAPLVPDYSYSWTPVTGLDNPAIANPMSSVGLTTAYKVRTSLNGCSSTDDVIVTVSPKFTVNAGPDMVICKGTPTVLTASSTGASSYIWSTEEHGSSITVAPMEATVYSVTGLHGGCRATDTLIIHIMDTIPPTLYIPNAFTPNGDGDNDVFKVYGESIIEMEASIFNRWGELIYAWDNLEGGWNGQLKPTEKKSEMALEEVFVYKIRVKNECKKVFQEPRSGVVTLIK